MISLPCDCKALDFVYCLFLGKYGESPPVYSICFACFLSIFYDVENIEKEYNDKNYGQLEVRLC